MRSEEDQKYLIDKHKGGLANAKGSLYEDYYAVFQIVRCLAQYKSQLDSVSFQSQLEDTFVDDLLIAHPKENVYHQLKNTKTISWSTSSSGRTVCSDFEKQIEDCRERNEQFALKLVYSAIDSNVKDTIPISIKEFSSTEYFPYQDDLNGLLFISGAFQEDLKAISARGDLSTLDELLNLAKIFLGVWKGCGTHGRVSLSQIVLQAEGVKDFNLAVIPDDVISESCKNVLDAIEGLEYHIRGRKIYWKFGNFTGSDLWSSELEKRITVEKPLSKKELLVLL